MKKTDIAFFDFDGTISKRDSIKLFSKYIYKHGFFFEYYIFDIFYLLNTVITGNYLILKQARINRLLKKFDSNYINKISKEFFSNLLIHDLREKAIEEINWHKKRNNKIVVVSASFDFIIKNFTQKFEIDLLTNRTTKKNNYYQFSFKNSQDCNFSNKVNFIKKNYDLKNYDKIYAYGNSKGDLKLLEIADYKNYKPFL